jgi:hypothetical protein
MANLVHDDALKPRWDRRAFLAALGSAAIMPAAAQTPQAQQPISPDAAPRDWSGQQPVRYPDPDIVALDNRFRRYIVGNTIIRRLYTGTLWAEGPAWNGVGRYLVWSDIPNNVQMRWIEDDAASRCFVIRPDTVTAIRSILKAVNSLANTVDAAWSAMNLTAPSR